MTLMIIFLWILQDFLLIFGLPVIIDDNHHFDSVSGIDLRPQQSIDYSMGSSANSWPFSFWLHRSTENAAEFHEFEEHLRDWNIVHLTARPLAVYYHDDFDYTNISKLLTNKVCRATISAQDTYHTLDKEESTLNIMFICSSGTCCGLDCCHLNIVFIFVLACIFLTLCTFGTYYGIKTLSTSKKLRHLLRFKRRRRVIQRANAQRRTHFNADFKMHTYQDVKSSEDEQLSPPTRKKSQSMKLPSKLNSSSPELFLVPPKDHLVHCNSVPTKHKPRKDSTL